MNLAVFSYSQYFSFNKMKIDPYPTIGDLMGSSRLMQSIDAAANINADEIRYKTIKKKKLTYRDSSVIYHLNIENSYRDWSILDPRGALNKLADYCINTERISKLIYDSVLIIELYEPDIDTLVLERNPFLLMVKNENKPYKIFSFYYGVMEQTLYPNQEYECSDKKIAQIIYDLSIINFSDELVGRDVRLTIISKTEVKSFFIDNAEEYYLNELSNLVKGNCDRY